MIADPKTGASVIDAGADDGAAVDPTDWVTSMAISLIDLKKQCEILYKTA
jgi:hypothetical protein